jgi:hypothetical protein
MAVKRSVSSDGESCDENCAEVNGLPKWEMSR